MAPPAAALCRGENAAHAPNCSAHAAHATEAPLSLSTDRRRHYVQLESAGSPVAYKARSIHREMNMHSRSSRGLVSVLAACAFTVSAFAGYQTKQPVSINDEDKQVNGDLGYVRNTSDSVQY